MPARRMQRLGFAVFFVVALLGALLLIISQVPLRRVYYEVVETRSFSPLEPLTFYYIFDPHVEYRLEVKGVNWGSSERYSHYISVLDDGYLSYRGVDERVEPPWVWDWSSSAYVEAVRLNVTFLNTEYGGAEIDRSTTPTTVEISEYRETTAKPTYLIYVGLPLLIISAILITIVGKDVDSRMQWDTIKKAYLSQKHFVALNVGFHIM